MHSGFWKSLPQPIVGLSPMDGVTNAPYRELVAEYAPADVSITEFVPVEGLMHKAVRLLRDFVYCDAERPIVAQIYGCDVDGYYAVAHLVCALGFDGIDINMGCPAKKVEQRGCGAGLIRTPEVAKDIVRATQRGVRDWANGQDPVQAGLPQKVWAHAQEMFGARVIQGEGPRAPIPVTVKTRIGYASNTVVDWVQHLLEVDPVVISIHGRTLKQMYKGQADWDAIAEAAAVIRQTDTLVLGNGDLHSHEDIAERIKSYGVHGVLVGRASMGNPWLLNGAVVRGDCAVPPVSPHDMRTAFVRHAQLQESFTGPKGFTQIRRFVKPYTLGWPNAVELRNQLYHAKDSGELAALLDTYWNEHQEAIDAIDPCIGLTAAP